MVRTVAILKYDANIMTRDNTMESGISRLGFFASSPVVATQSKPTKPKKHLAAPAITPATPHGINPPAPADPRCSSGISSTFIFQFAGSPRSYCVNMCKCADQLSKAGVISLLFIAPAITTTITVVILRAVKTLFILVDSLTPTARRTEIKKIIKLNEIIASMN